MPTTLKPISSIGSHRLAWSIATGLPINHRNIDALQGLIRLLIQNKGVVALNHRNGAHQLGITQQQFRDLSTWALKNNWITVLHELRNIGKVYGIGSAWQSLNWEALERRASDEHRRGTPKVDRRLVLAARRERCLAGSVPQTRPVCSPDQTSEPRSVPQTRPVCSPDQTYPTKPLALEGISTPYTTSDTPSRKDSFLKGEQAEVEPQAYAFGSGPAEISAQQPEQPEQQEDSDLISDVDQTVQARASSEPWQQSAEPTGHPSGRCSLTLDTSPAGSALQTAPHQEQIPVEYISDNEMQIEVGMMVNVYNRLGVVTGLNDEYQIVEYWEFSRFPDDLTVDQYQQWVENQLSLEKGSHEQAYSNLITVLSPEWQLSTDSPSSHSLEEPPTPVVEQNTVTC